MPLPPPLSPEQRTAALAKASEARKRRAEIKESLRSGATKLNQLLESVSDEVVGKMKVVSVLEAMPGVGKIRAKKIMERLEISESRRIRGLGQKQKEALLKEFRER